MSRLNFAGSVNAIMAVTSIVMTYTLGWMLRKTNGFESDKNTSVTQLHLLIFYLVNVISYLILLDMFES